MTDVLLSVPSPPALPPLPLVVLIDDHPVNLTLLRHLLARDRGCQTVQFTDPEEGLAFCRDTLPDLVLVDYMMPVMSGIEFIRLFRDTPGRRDIPILMVTANDERSVRHNALDAGATDFLNKPIDNRELLSRVRNMLSLRAAMKHEAERAESLACEVARATADLVDRERELVTRISRAAEFRDPETGEHIRRMAHYSALIARILGRSAADQEMLLAAAPMHDVGKIAIPDAILLKPGRLNPEEFRVMQEHARFGYELLHGSGAAILQIGAEIALTHHEKFNGTGYPRGLTGTDIPIFGRIVAVADVYDALTTPRPYKRAWTCEAARELLISERGRHFDPDCVDAFLAAWREVGAIAERFGEADWNADPEPT